MRLHNPEFSKGFFVDFVMKGFRIFFGHHWILLIEGLNIWETRHKITCTIFVNILKNEFLLGCKIMACIFLLIPLISIIQMILNLSQYITKYFMIYTIRAIMIISPCCFFKENISRVIMILDPMLHVVSSLIKIMNSPIQAGGNDIIGHIFK